MKVQNLETPLCCISSCDLHITIQVLYLLELQGIYIHISESTPEIWMSIKPRHPSHSGAILSETLHSGSKSMELAVGEGGVFTTPLWQECMALQRLRSQPTACHKMPPASSSNSSGQAWRWAVRSCNPPALRPARVCSKSPLLSQALSNTSPHCPSQQQRCQWQEDRCTHNSDELFGHPTPIQSCVKAVIAGSCR